jgi:phosphotriesterase-related protein
VTTVRTVLGDVAAASLGRVNYHEHLFQASPLLPGDDLDDEGASGVEAGTLRSSGFDSMIDATPIGLGRRPEAVARISESTGLHVVAATGTHRDAHYGPQHPLRRLDGEQRASRYLGDLLVGMPVDDESGREIAPAMTAAGTPIRAGLVKTGIGYWSISEFERETLRAAALAHLETGAPVMVHLEFCTAANEVLDLLEQFGVSPNRVVLAHADRDPNPALHLQLAARGAWLGYDGIARPRIRSEAELLDLTELVVEAGAGDAILLGADVARRSRYVSYGGMPGLGYLGSHYVPRLVERIGVELVDRILTNPQRFLPWSR